jgi:RNA polymerase sigma-70 factor (ECF subfamily)
MSFDEEMDLVTRARSGDKVAFEGLYNHYKVAINQTVRRRLDTELVEDAVQEIFIKAWRALPGFEGRSSFNTWLNRIALNQCLDEIRKRTNPLAGFLATELSQDDIDHRRFDVLPRWSLSHASPELSAFHQELWERLRGIVSRLPSKQGDAIWMKIATGMTEGEISDLTGWPIGTVRSLVSRALAALREQPQLDEIKQLLFGQSKQPSLPEPRRRLGETLL